MGVVGMLRLSYCEAIALRAALPGRCIDRWVWISGFPCIKRFVEAWRHYWLVFVTSRSPEIKNGSRIGWSEPIPA